MATGAPEAREQLPVLVAAAIAGETFHTVVIMQMSFFMVNFDQVVRKGKFIREEAFAGEELLEVSGEIVITIKWLLACEVFHLDPHHGCVIPSSR